MRSSAALVPGRVTIGIPLYNALPGAIGAVRAVLDQTHRSLEVIISDNASTDGTLEAVTAECGGDPRVRILSQPVNLGPVANFEAVLAAASGEFFAWAAHDDLRSNDFVEVCVGALRGAPGASMAYPTVGHIGPDDAEWVAEGDDFDTVGLRPAERVVAVCRGMHRNAPIYGVWRTAQARRLRFDGVVGEDITEMMRASARGEFVRVAGPTRFWYRVDPRKDYAHYARTVASFGTSPASATLGYRGVVGRVLATALELGLVHGSPDRVVAAAAGMCARKWGAFVAAEVGLAGPYGAVRPLTRSSRFQRWLRGGR